MKKLLIFIVICSFLFGCQAGEKTQIMNISDENIDEIASVFEEDRRLTNTILIVQQDEVFAAIQVKTLSKFHKRKIENDLKEKVQQVFEVKNVTISADYKATLSSREILQEKNSEEVRGKVEELVALLEEKT